MNQIEFLQLTTPFKDKIFRLAKRLLVSTEEAEDATQEVYVKLWSKEGSLKKYNNVEAFAMTMTKNYCLDQLKSKRSDNQKLTHDNYSDGARGLADKSEDRDSLHWVEKLMQQLPDQQRIVIQMRDIEGYEFAAIAKVMEMNETAIRVALSRARKTLREAMIKVHNYGIE
jgi:RNA polymerase sigma-70 factor (ECF subfamily)